MKKLILIVLSQLMCFQAFAWRESNGGTGVAAEASMISQALLDDIFAVPALKSYYHVKPFNVFAKTDLMLNGQHVDAYSVTDTENDIPDTIFIDSDSWNKMSDKQKRLLMLHELTHFMAIYDYGYSSSQLTINKLEKFELLKMKYPFAIFPIDNEFEASIAKCDLYSFVNVYRLVLDIDYLLPTMNKTIRSLVDESSCKNIKEYAPLVEIMKK